MTGKISKFSLETIISYAEALGLHPADSSRSQGDNPISRSMCCCMRSA